MMMMTDGKDGKGFMRLSALRERDAVDLGSFGPKMPAHERNRPRAGAWFAWLDD